MIEEGFGEAPQPSVQKVYADDFNMVTKFGPNLTTSSARLVQLLHKPPLGRLCSCKEKLLWEVIHTDQQLFTYGMKGDRAGQMTERDNCMKPSRKNRILVEAVTLGFRLPVYITFWL